MNTIEALFIYRTECAHAWLAKRSRVVVSSILVERVDCLHLFNRQEEVKDVAVFDHARRIRRFAQRVGIALDRPSKQHLGWSLVLTLRNLANRCIFHK